MNESEIARLEQELQLKLPAAYVAITRQLDQELVGLYGSLGKGMQRPLMWNGTDTLQTNLLIRNRPAFFCTAPAEFVKGWPNPYLACGYERAGNIFYVIDTRSQDLLVHQILSKTKRLEACEKFPTLESLREYALKKYRELSAKHVKSWGQKKGPPHRSAVTAKGKPKKRVAEAQPDSRTMKTLTKLLRESGFKISPPKRSHSIAELTADFLPELPRELLALFSVCDGGSCKRLGLRLLSLAEAARLARTFAEWSPSMGYFPIADSPQTDPCFVATKGPLQGFVFFVHHDGPHAILARSVSRFLSVLAQNRGGKGWNLEDAMMPIRKSIYAPFEFAEEKRTASDLQAARELLKVAERQIGKQDEGPHLFEMALKLLSTKKPNDILPLLKHRVHEVRQLAQIRLGETKSTKVASALQEADQELAGFVKHAVRVLKQAGLDAKVVDRTSIRIDPYPIWLNVPTFFDRRKDRDVWDFLVERAKFFVSLER